MTWQKWVIGALSTALLLFASLYINSVSDRVDDVKASTVAIDSESRRQGERLAVVEEQQRSQRDILKEMRDDLKAIRSQLTGKP